MLSDRFFSKFFLSIFLFAFLGLISFASCYVEEKCVNLISSNDLNPANSRCERRCDCNNQLYEGRCVQGKCVAYPRDTCSHPGLPEKCTPKFVFLKCQSGIRICRDKGLLNNYYGDCLCKNSSELLLEPHAEQPHDAGPDKTTPDSSAPDKATPDSSTPDKVAPDNSSLDRLPEKTMKEFQREHLLVEQSKESHSSPSRPVVLIKAGSFWMGSLLKELGRQNDEDQHRVTLTFDFYMWKHEVTQSEFSHLMNYNPSFPKSCPKCPVNTISWHEAVAFCNALSLRDHLTTCYQCSGSRKKTNCKVKKAYEGKKYYRCPGYRLPTEAEWEYAYRAGTTTAFYNGNITVSIGFDPKLDQIAWFDKNSNRRPHLVEQKSPNAWGLYDMAGNAAEWTYDFFSGHLGITSVTNPVDDSSSSQGKRQRVLRGGSCYSPPKDCRAARRMSDLSTLGYSRYGVRPVRTAHP